MKDVIKSAVDTYAMRKLRYGIVVYGSKPVTWTDFGDEFSSDEDLKTLIDSLPRPKDRPALDEALIKGKELFDKSQDRPNAKKVLVVITDKKSTSNLVDVEDAAKPLEKSGIKLIPVAIGDEADVAELEKITTVKGDIINVTKDVEPVHLREKIMKKAFQGEKRIFMI